MTRAGIKSVTFAAQNPMLTYYYHTWRDMPERFEMETVGDGFDVILGRWTTRSPLSRKRTATTALRRNKSKMQPGKVPCRAVFVYL